MLSPFLGYEKERATYFQLFWLLDEVNPWYLWSYLLQLLSNWSTEAVFTSQLISYTFSSISSICVYRVNIYCSSSKLKPVGLGVMNPLVNIAMPVSLLQEREGEREGGEREIERIISDRPLLLLFRKLNKANFYHFRPYSWLHIT